MIFDPHDPDFQQLGYPARHWLDVTNRNIPCWMRRLHNPNLGLWQKLTTSRGQAGLGLVVLAFSLAVVVANPIRDDGWVLLVIMVVIMVLALVYWVLFVRLSSASGIYNWFGYQLHEFTHGENDRDDLSRRCNWCQELPENSAHRHPHDSYKDFNEVKVIEVGNNRFRLRTRIPYFIFGDGSREDLKIHPWSNFQRN